jgi:hypothetical protein
MDKDELIETILEGNEATAKVNIEALLNQKRDEVLAIAKQKYGKTALTGANAE